MDLRKDDIIQMRIEDISDTGEGIGKTEGFTWFVKGAVPGDVVQARVTGVKKTYGFAETVRLITPSPCRVRPLCPCFEECGGCQLQDMDYESQLKFKENMVKNQLRRIGGVSGAEELVRPVAGMEHPWRYRNNEQFYPGVDEYGRPVFGFYAGRTHEIIKPDDCLVGIEENPIILNSIIKYMEEYNIRPCDEKTGGGIIGRVQIRKGFATGQIMVCLDIHGPLSGLKVPGALVQNLCSLFPSAENGSHIESICAHVSGRGGTSQSGRENGEEEVTDLFGPGFITDRIGGLEFQISPLSFYQVNPAQTERLYDTVLDFARLTGGETVVDLYCGTGTISLFLARKAGQVYGAETVPLAIKDAQANARRNGIENVRFFTGRVEDVLPYLYEKARIKADVIVLDPPRRGCAPSCLDTMIRMRPERIVYVSCDSATLSRDIKILQDGGYALRAVQPIDLFPQSVHIENVSLLEIVR